MSANKTLKDYYDILDIPDTADEAAIKAAYRAGAMKHHPDRNSGSKAAEERFKLVCEAYGVLMDPARKYHYDRLRVQQNPALYNTFVPYFTMGSSSDAAKRVAYLHREARRIIESSPASPCAEVLRDTAAEIMRLAYEWQCDTTEQISDILECLCAVKRREVLRCKLLLDVDAMLRDISLYYGSGARQQAVCEIWDRAHRRPCTGALRDSGVCVVARSIYEVIAGQARTLNLSITDLMREYCGMRGGASEASAVCRLFSGAVRQTVDDIFRFMTFSTLDASDTIDAVMDLYCGHMLQQTEAADIHAVLKALQEMDEIAGLCSYDISGPAGHIARQFCRNKEIQAKKMTLAAAARSLGDIICLVQRCSFPGSDCIINGIRSIIDERQNMIRRVTHSITHHRNEAARGAAGS